MRRSVIGICCVAMIFGLASCGKDDSEPMSDSAECVTLESSFGAQIEECQFTMRDNRRVNCILSKQGYSGGISCDWLHADGTDAHISGEGTTR